MSEATVEEVIAELKKRQVYRTCNGGTTPLPDALCHRAAAELTRLRAENERMREALEFYAQPKAYLGPNQRNPGDNKFTNREAPYFHDVSRDNGGKARSALGERNGGAG